MAGLNLGVINRNEAMDSELFAGRIGNAPVAIGLATIALLSLGALPQEEEMAGAPRWPPSPVSSRGPFVGPA